MTENLEPHPAPGLRGADPAGILAGTASLPGDGANRQDRTGRNAARDEHGNRHGCQSSACQTSTPSSRHSKTPHYSIGQIIPGEPRVSLSRMKIRPRNRRIGILLSGRGSNFEAIATNVSAGKLRAEIAVVISNVEAAPGLARARERGLRTLYLPSKGRQREYFDQELVASVERDTMSGLSCWPVSCGSSAL